MINDLFYERDCLIWKIEHEKQDLQARIDKAIEYIEKNADNFMYSYAVSDNIVELLEILKGSDSNE